MKSRHEKLSRKDRKKAKLRFKRIKKIEKYKIWENDISISDCGVNHECRYKLDISKVKPIFICSKCNGEIYDIFAIKNLLDDICINCQLFPEKKPTMTKF